ncbi:MAG: tripartite tricarboxylate transporter substrate binding protein, partial [Comamonadaceae bacterium]
VDAYLAQARAEPGRVTFATPGTGSSGHFATEQFLKLTRTSMNHIPYKGAAQAVSDLMGGQVDSSFATLGSVLPQVVSGKLTALAVATPARLPQLPQVPTFDEAGVKGYAADAWYGVLAPARLPQDVRATLEKVAQDFASAPGTAKSLDTMGMQPRQICGSAFTEQLTREVDTYRKLASELDLKAE